MKHSHFIPFLILLICFTSCGVQKRRYLNGYYFSLSNKKTSDTQKEHRDKGISYKQPAPEINNIQNAVSNSDTIDREVRHAEHKFSSPVKAVSERKIPLQSILEDVKAMISPKQNKSASPPNYELDFEAERKLKSKSMASFVFAVLAAAAILFAFIFEEIFLLPYLLFTIVSLIFSCLSLSQRKNFPYRIPQTDFAMAALVINLVIIFALLALMAGSYFFW